MLPLETLQRQHTQLRDLTQVLLVMSKHQSLRHTEIYSELCGRLEDQVKEHLALEDGTVYPELLQHAEGELRTTADNLLSGSIHLKKLFSEYLAKQKKYQQRADLDPALEEQSARESQEMLRLLLERMALEEQRFFPALEEADAAGRSGRA